MMNFTVRWRYDGQADGKKLEQGRRGGFNVAESGENVLVFALKKPNWHSKRGLFS